MGPDINGARAGKEARANALRRAVMGRVWGERNRQDTLWPEQAPDRLLQRFAEGIAEQLTLLEGDPVEGDESGADYDGNYGRDGEDGQASLTGHGPNGERVDAGVPQGEVLEGSRA